MEDEYIKKVTTGIILLALLVLSFYILKPILMSVIFGILLAFIFMPVYGFIYKKIKLENVSAILICVLLAILIIVPVWLLTPMLIEQSFKFFVSSQQIDFITPLKKIFPSVLASEEFSQKLGSTISTFVTKIASSLMNSFSDILLKLPQLSLQFLVVLFTFYFVLRDKYLLLEYIKSILPFSKEVEKKLFDQTRSITSSVLYGQVVVGLLQGAIAGLAFFIFKVPNALLLTLFAMLGGILPVLGTAVVWLPAALYLFVGGNNIAAVGVIAFGIISSTIDNILRPYIVAKRVHMPSSIIFIGMIGGLFVFGILGLILGPLILAYLLIILELYRNKRVIA